MLNLILIKEKLPVFLYTHRERIELGRELETKVKLNDDDEEGSDVEVDKGEMDVNDGGVGEVANSSGEEERVSLERSLQQEEEEAEQNDNGQRNPWLRSTFFEEIKTTTTTTTTTAVESGGESCATSSHRQSRQMSNKSKISTESTGGKGGRVLEVPVSFRLDRTDSDELFRSYMSLQNSEEYTLLYFSLVGTHESSQRDGST